MNRKNFVEKQQQLKEITNIELNPKSEFLKVQNECYLCGHGLDTYVEHIPSTRFTVERAQCHNCMTLVRVKNHTVQ